MAQAMSVENLHVRSCARADVPPFPYFGNGLTDDAEICCVVREMQKFPQKTSPSPDRRHTESDQPNTDPGQHLSNTALSPAANA